MARLDSLPIYFGQVKRRPQGQIRSTPNGRTGSRHRQRSEKMTKYAVLVMDPTIFAFTWKRRVPGASGRPGPVWIDIPLDVQAARLMRLVFALPTPKKANLPEGLSAMSLLLFECFASRSVRSSSPATGATGGAQESFRSLSRSLKVPVLLTWLAIICSRTTKTSD